MPRRGEWRRRSCYAACSDTGTGSARGDGAGVAVSDDNLGSSCQWIFISDSTCSSGSGAASASGCQWVESGAITTSTLTSLAGEALLRGARVTGNCQCQCCLSESPPQPRAEAASEPELERCTDGL